MWQNCCALSTHPKDDEVHPPGTVVWWKHGGRWALIKEPVYRFQGKFFSHYLGEVEEREGHYCLLHDDVQLECYPVDHPEFGREYLRL